MEIAMLILKRHQGEKILIGDDITITLVECAPHFARIGIQAPRDIDVDRQEVRLKVLRDGRKKSDDSDST
jgi:carbon storage regulator